MGRRETITDEQRMTLFEAAIRYGDRHDLMLKSPLGADVSDAEFWRLLARAAVDVAMGRRLTEALADRGDEWRTYAAEVTAKINATVKIARGPSGGHSAMGHRSVDPERWDSMAASELKQLCQRAGLEV